MYTNKKSNVAIHTTMYIMWANMHLSIMEMVCGVSNEGSVVPSLKFLHQFPPALRHVVTAVLHLLLQTLLQELTLNYIATDT